MLASEILQDAKDRITPLRNWTQGTPARDASGLSLSSQYIDSAKATSWCAVGSVMKTFHKLEIPLYDPIDGIMESSPRYDQIRNFLDRAARVVSNRQTAIHLNDKMFVFFSRLRVHKKVMKMFDKAIEIAKQMEKINEV